MVHRDNEAYLTPQQATVLRAVTLAAENLRTVRSVAEMEIKQRVQEAVRSAELKRDDLIREAHGMGVKDASLKRAIGNKNHENLKRILGSYVPSEVTSVPQFEFDWSKRRFTFYWWMDADGVRHDVTYSGKFNEHWGMVADADWRSSEHFPMFDSVEAAVKPFIDEYKEEN